MLAGLSLPLVAAALERRRGCKQHSTGDGAEEQSVSHHRRALKKTQNGSLSRISQTWLFLQPACRLREGFESDNWPVIYRQRTHGWARKMAQWLKVTDDLSLIPGHPHRNEMKELTPPKLSSDLHTQNGMRYQ